jgi:hypothetical protein
MNTNQFLTTENIKAVGGLWPLVLCVFLILLLLVLVTFFLSQTRSFLNGLKNFRFKFFNAEASVNQPQNEPPKINTDTSPQEATSGQPKTVEKEVAPTDGKKEPELELDPEEEMCTLMFEGRLDEAERIFERLQSSENDPEERIKREAVYLRIRFQKGDISAQDKLHALEIRAKEKESICLGMIIRQDGQTRSKSGESRRGLYQVINDLLVAGLPNRCFRKYIIFGFIASSFRIESWW